MSRLHTVTYRATGGRIGRRLVNNDMLLLTTTGRRTGDEHTVPLLYLSDGADVVVIASWGGRDYPPHWYLNLVAHPAAAVRIQDERWQVTVHELGEPERTEWWERAVAAYEGYAVYQSRTSRTIPVIRLVRSS